MANSGSSVLLIGVSCPIIISYGMVARALVRDSDLQPSPRALRDPRAWLEVTITQYNVVPSVPCHNLKQSRAPVAVP